MSFLSSYLTADWNRLTSLVNSTPSSLKLRHFFSPRFAPVVLIRISHCLHINRWTRLAKLPALFNFIIFGIEVPPSLKIGKGLVLMHTQGTVLGAASIGCNVTIYHQVTLGAKMVNFNFDPSLRPIVDDDVTIYVGGKVLGGLTLGRGSVVGANAVVLRSVEPLHLAIGIPAKNQPL